MSLEEQDVEELVENTEIDEEIVEEAEVQEEVVETEAETEAESDEMIVTSCLKQIKNILTQI